MGCARINAFTSAGKPLDAYVDKIYTSYEAGSTKPAPGIFNYMIQDSKLNPAETIFVDDGCLLYTSCYILVSFLLVLIKYLLCVIGCR